jgi:D-3-phosphoglycerate dehydrogenase
MKPKIMIGPSTFAATDALPLEKLKAAGFEVLPNPFGRKLTKAELAERLPGVAGLIAGLETLDRDVLAGSELKVISRCGAGMENVDLVAAREFGIRVYSTPDAPTAAVAELTLAAMLSMLRSIPQMDRDMHDGKWNKRIGAQLAGKTVAVIGFGRIGRYVARLLKSFGAVILAVDPAVTADDILKEGAKPSGTDEALAKADIITIHVNGANHIIGDKELKAVKRGVYILNGARGCVIDERALVRAIKEGRVAGVWCDAFPEEPYTGELTKYESALLTPHVGSYTRECRSRMEAEAVENLIKGFGE